MIVNGDGGRSTLVAVAYMVRLQYTYMYFHYPPSCWELHNIAK